MSSFAPAVKQQLKARVALDGPTGSGKTWTALEWATVLADGGRIAFIDTERDSARLYAHRFEFDVARFDPPYEPERLVKMLHEAVDAGYAVVVVDSLTHFWEGEGGVLDIVDGAAQRSGGGNSFAGWKVGTPAQRHMVDTIIGLDAHVIVTMRSKMDYVLEPDSKGKMVPRKVGMAPVQRAGIEYEFQLVGDLDLEHRIVVSKSRCDVLADKVVQPGRAGEAAAQFVSWLNDGEEAPPPADRREVDAFLEDVKHLDDETRTAMNAWWKESGFRSDQLTADDLLVAQAQLARIAGSVANGEQGAPPVQPELAAGDGSVSPPVPSPKRSEKS